MKENSLRTFNLIQPLNTSSSFLSIQGNTYIVSGKVMFIKSFFGNFRHSCYNRKKTLKII